MKTINEVKRISEVPVVVADHDGIITYVNKAFGALFGWAPKEIIGQTLTAIIPPNLHDAHHLGFSRFVTTGKATLINQPLRLKAVTKDGKEFDAEHVIIAEEHQGQWMFAATIRPLP
jgi:PAS domain S-box-containing protein